MLHNVSLKEHQDFCLLCVEFLCILQPATHRTTPSKTTKGKTKSSFSCTEICKTWLFFIQCKTRTLGSQQ